ncbi:MAG: T9SS type A sorting domain-containing protein [Bacteroidetes bacterium]|nr:T9SS type A sorting domain-containing protein [Bacteroidota bacterium]
MKKTILIASSFVLLGLQTQAQTPGQVKILFDNTHAETSGTTADWCIDADVWNMNWASTTPSGYTCTTCHHSNPQRIPTPAQSGITSTTSETFWTGALSYWAIDCVRKGYWVETLPFTDSITYGNSGNPQDLSNYNVFVVDEPNTRFTQSEIAAMMHFIENGGSLLAISDHDHSDRNNDGWDSPHIWNDFFTNNPVQNNAFGYVFSYENFSDGSSSPNTNVATSTTDSIIHGPFGTCAMVKWSNGTAMNMTPSQNPSVKGHVWRAGLGQTDTAVCCVTSRWKCGKIASIGDSSPPDDGTGNPSSTLYTGYTGDASGNHRPWLMNIMIWLATPVNCATTGINTVQENKKISVYPNPTNSHLQLITEDNTATEAIIYDMLGRIVQKTAINKSLSTIDVSSIPNGVYFIQVGSYTQKFIKSN